MEQFSTVPSSTQVSPEGEVCASGGPPPASQEVWGGAPEGAPLLYLNSNNSTGFDKFPPEIPAAALLELSPYHRKQAFVLGGNVQKFIGLIGLNRCGFLTLTFPDNVTDNKEASRRFNILRTHFLSRFFGEWMLVKERQVRGAWHYHILIDCRTDIRTGINWAEIDPPKGKRPKYTSACPALRSIWQLLRERLPSYGFGRSELLPIKKESEAVSSYMGKYIGKHLSAREEKDKGVRLVSYSSHWSKSSVKMAWHSDGSQEWRRKLAKFSHLTGCHDLDDLKAVFGPHWAHSLKEYVNQVDTLTPSEILRIKVLYRRAQLGPGEFDTFPRPNRHRLVYGDFLPSSSKDIPGSVVRSRLMVDSKTGEVLF